MADDITRSPEEGGRIIEEPIGEALSRRYLAYALSTITSRVSGKNSFPCSTVKVYRPGGSSTRKGWAESVVCISTAFVLNPLRRS